MAYPSYSELFHTLYDEPTPVGSLGRGTHYSILSAVQWADNHRKMLHIPQMQRFAVIWDEDHDERVIKVIEAAYMRGIFAPVLYIGESKACLTVFVNDYFFDIIQHDLVSYTMAWEELSTQTHGDFWNFELVRSSDAVISASGDKVATYLKNIDNLWGLGCRDYMQPTPERLTPLSCNSLKHV